MSGLHKNRIKVGRNELHVTNDSLIGIASRDISSFVNNVLKSSDVAEFLSVPKDIFELNNLAEVLSYHVRILGRFLLIFYEYSKMAMDFFGILHFFYRHGRQIYLV